MPWNAIIAGGLLIISQGILAYCIWRLHSRANVHRTKIVELDLDIQDNRGQTAVLTQRINEIAVAQAVGRLRSASDPRIDLVPVSEKSPATAKKG